MSSSGQPGRRPGGDRNRAAVVVPAIARDRPGPYLPGLAACAAAARARAAAAPPAAAGLRAAQPGLGGRAAARGPALGRPRRRVAAGCAALAALAAAAWPLGWVNPALAVLALAVAAAAARPAAGRCAVTATGYARRSTPSGTGWRPSARSSRAGCRPPGAARPGLPGLAAAPDRVRPPAAVVRRCRCPADIDRVDVAGGTLAGWSALLTTIAAPRLAAGGEVTVLDLTEGAVAADLVAVARRSGIDPLVWVLPGGPAAAGPGHRARQPGPGRRARAGGRRQRAAGRRRRGRLWRSGQGRGHPRPGARGARRPAGHRPLPAALRVLAEVGTRGPTCEPGLLTAGQVRRISGLFGRGAAERVVIERAWALESRLTAIWQLGSRAVRPGAEPAADRRLDRRSA